MAFYSRSVFNILYVSVLLGTFNAQASDDAYMKMLEAEAVDSHLDQGGQRKKNSTAHNSPVNNIEERDWVGECDYMDDTVPSGLVWEEFSSYLKQCSLGIYVFYQRLEPGLQRSVYNTYAKNSPTTLTLLKKDVLNYF